MSSLTLIENGLRGPRHDFDTKSCMTLTQPPDLQFNAGRDVKKPWLKSHATVRTSGGSGLGFWHQACFWNCRVMGPRTTRVSVPIAEAVAATAMTTRLANRRQLFLPVPPVAEHLVLQAESSSPAVAPSFPTPGFKPPVWGHWSIKSPKTCSSRGEVTGAHVEELHALVLLLADLREFLLSSHTDLPVTWP